MLLANATFLCIGLTAGALLSFPRRRPISELRLSLRDVCTELVATDKRIQGLRESVALGEGRHEGMCRRIGNAEQAHEALAANMLQLGVELNGRLDALQGGPAGPEAVTGGFTEVSRRLNSLENRLDERLTGLERRMSELSNQDALVATIDRQLQDMQRFIVEAAERARQPGGGVASAPVAPAPVAPAPVAAAPATPAAMPVTGFPSADLERLLAMQQQAQQAFALRRRDGGFNPPGSNGGGL